MERFTYSRLFYFLNLCKLKNNNNFKWNFSKLQLWIMDIICKLVQINNQPSAKSPPFPRVVSVQIRQLLQYQLIKCTAPSRTSCLLHQNIFPHQGMLIIDPHIYIPL